MTKGAKVFQQGEKIHGMYLIGKGQVQYSRQMKVANLSTSKNYDCNWINNVLKKDPADDNCMETRNVVVFSENDTIGFEEILHCKIVGRLRDELEQAKERKEFDKMSKLRRYDLSERAEAGQYNFTATVMTLNASLFYLSRENYESFSRYVGTEVESTELETRMDLIQHQLNTICKVNKARFVNV